MFQVRLRQKGRPLIHLRYADEWVGLLVLIAMVLFAAAVIEAGVLSDWLSPPARLRVVLPETGVGGLTVGGDVQILGAHAGTIRAIKLNPTGGMYALVDLDPQVEPFLRRDSKAVIRKAFVVAGASYLDLTRGSGEAMDWNYAVINAITEPSPTDMITQTLKDIQAQIMPALSSARHMMAQLDEAITDMHAGKGSVGQLMTNDDLVRKSEAMIVSLNEVINRLRPEEEQLRAILSKTDTTMANVKSATHDLKNATPRLPSITRNVDESLSDVPAMLTQAQTTLYSLQKLTDQLKGLWLLGGHQQKSKNRLPARKVAP
ncbi:MlaD family protein [Acetobacter sicerae]|uniref:MlaD family protein n=1 Tax=Acetobacter sicerae TaxID=85325 RepID=A0ABS8VQ28_9PROT|nr:MlaD family protein [Acetobacter sicerae]MCE0742440.1 MlaD family protein [Acetobacter sicerae]NHN90547.1 MCE family protein [Acetobacter sicerae]